MANNELKKLSRAELIDIIYQLRLENTRLEQELENASSELKEKKIKLEDAGSIAEAALKLNGVFDAAQEAAEQYIVSVKDIYADMEKQLEGTKQQCLRMISRAESEASEIKSDAEMEAAEKLAAADIECKRRYEVFLSKASQYIKEHPEIRELYAVKTKD